MDVTFKTEFGRFNYRVGAIILHGDEILAMHDERSPYYYLPGGRVRLHETAEHAILREIKEELEIDAEIIRPLWLSQSFFTEVVDQDRFHEICLYYLVDVSRTDLFSRGKSFVLHEGKHTHSFQWLNIHRLKSEYIFPTFIREKILDIPEHLTIIEEHE